MNYVKPEIAVLASANTAIQGVSKSTIPAYDNIVNGYTCQTVGAYEADE
jgi:hypothetical protein